MGVGHPHPVLSDLRRKRLPVLERTWTVPMQRRKGKPHVPWLSRSRPNPAGFRRAELCSRCALGSQSSSRFTAADTAPLGGNTMLFTLRSFPAPELQPRCKGLAGSCWLGSGGVPFSLLEELCVLCSAAPAAALRIRFPLLEVTSTRSLKVKNHEQSKPAPCHCSLLRSRKTVGPRK